MVPLSMVPLNIEKILGYYDNSTPRAPQTFFHEFDLG